MSQDKETEYDVIVIGGGPVGENAASYAIGDSTRTVALIESELVGGECSYWACMPSKALLVPGAVLEQARNMPGVKQIIGDSTLDVDAVLARRDSYTSHLDDSSQVKWAEGAGMDVIRGHGRISGDKEVTVGDRVLRARHAVIIATGTTASVAPVPGLADALPWTSRDATNLHEIPRRVLVIGGGVVAVESVTWLLALGADHITMVVRGSSLLAGSEPFAGEAVTKSLSDRGVRILFDSEVESVDRPDARDTGYGHVHGGVVTAVVAGESITVDEIVAATGRTPSSSDIGLAAIGLDDGGYIQTDDHLRVTGVDGDWLYAVGDVNGRALLTHMGKYQGRVCGDVISARADGKSITGARFVASADHGQVPQVVFSSPEVSSVGLTEQQARDAGVDVEIVEQDIAVAGSSLQQDNYAGHAKLVIDSATETIVGATFVGPGVAELVHAATIAVVGKVPLETLWHAVPSYPTVSELWLRLLESRR